MSVSANPTTDSTMLAQPRKASESNQPDVLTNIYNDVCNMAIWRRDLADNFMADIDELLATKSPIQIEKAVTPKRAASDMHKSLQTYACAKPLSENIAELVDMFCTLFDLNEAGLRLTTLNQAMCPRFHVDKIPCRLITTYQGSATQWLPNGVVDRTKLGAGNNGLPDEQSGIYQNPDDIQQLNHGDVALLKGELWQGNENAGLVHRSPTPKSGETRLLLTLDFLR